MIGGSDDGGDLILQLSPSGGRVGRLVRKQQRRPPRMATQHGRAKLRYFDHVDRATAAFDFADGRGFGKERLHGAQAQFLHVVGADHADRGAIV